MIIEEILNELNIVDYIYDKQDGIIKIGEAVNFQSQELGKITSSLKQYKVVFTVDRNHNIRISSLLYQDNIEKQFLTLYK